MVSAVVNFMKKNIKIQDIIEIAKEAGKIAMSFYDKKYTIKQKQNKTPVTKVDMAINDFLMEKLSKYNFPILSEEMEDNFEMRKNADFVWIIDPLDGTADFIQKTGEFSVMIGLVDKRGETVLGVIYAPALDELYYAQKSKGAYFVHTKQCTDAINRVCTEDDNDGRNASQCVSIDKIKVSDNSIQNGKILTSRNHLGDYEQKIAKENNMEQIPMGSVGPKVGRIARGNAELYINSSNKSGLWDICAADIILQEAGGIIRDKMGNEIKYSTKEVRLLNGYITTNNIDNLNKITAL